MPQAASIDIDFISKVAIPIATFVLGFFVSRFTLTKKERLDVESQKVKLAGELATEQEKAFQLFCAALNKYNSTQGESTLDDFFEIATKGEAYFNRLKITCDAILADKVDRLSVQNTHRPLIKEAVDKSLPEFYATLKFIAEKKGIQYSGKFKRENYLSVYQVYEKQI